MPEIIEEKKEKRLTNKEELFCKFYASDKEFFGNGVESYLEAYSTKKKPVTYTSAKTLACRLLTKVHILTRINELMDIMVNDIVADKELAFTILQKGDLNAKVAAIREYNKLRQRITEKLQITFPQTLIDLIRGASENDKTSNEK